MNDTNSELLISQKKVKTPKHGIIYLSTIPPYMNVTRIKEVFGDFGTVKRVYLQLSQPDAKQNEKKRKIATKFNEGWVEFERKSVAKKVALLLNNKQVSTRKKSKQYDYIWNIKYLSNFKWTHLHERLAYEKAARKQKLRAEIHLAKQKTNFFTTSSRKKSLINLNFSKTNKEETEIVEDPQNRKQFLKSLF